MANAKAGCREQVLEEASSFGCWSKVNKREALQGIWERQGGRQQVTEGLAITVWPPAFSLCIKN